MCLLATVMDQKRRLIEFFIFTTIFFAALETTSAMGPEDYQLYFVLGLKQNEENNNVDVNLNCFPHSSFSMNCWRK